MKNSQPRDKELTGTAPAQSDVGEKAYVLGLLTRHGFPVPRFRVISNSHFSDFVSQNGLAGKIQALLSQCDSKDIQSFNRAQEKIGKLLAGQRFADTLVKEIKRICTDFSGPLMVRSSAVGEDSTEASFAGQLDSFQTDGTIAGVTNALRKCWASYWSARALSYQHAKGKMLNGMGVIVQELVAPVFAGVVFTQSPTYVEDEMLIEYCAGHGEKLVSGKVTPGEIIVNKKSGAIRLVPYFQEHATSPGPTPISTQSPFVLELFRQSLELEKLFAGPLDIEWAVTHESKLFLLQARPITTAKKLERKTFWSNVNVNENYPKPISPFLYSLALKSYYFYFRNLAKSLGVRRTVLLEAEPQLSNIIGAHGARMYYNMTNIHGAISLLPLGPTFSSFFNDFVGVDKDETGQARKNKQHGFNIAATLSFAGNTCFSLLLVPFRVKRFERSADNHLNTFYEAGKPRRTRQLQSLTRQLQEFLTIRFHKWNDAALADLSAMLSYGALGTYLQKIYPADEARAKQNLLLQGIPNLVSSKPPQKIWELAQLIKNNRPLLEIFTANDNPETILAAINGADELQQFREAFEQFLNTWGYRCSGELMLTEPNFLEQPGKLIELLQGYLANENRSPRAITAAKTAEKKLLLASIRKDILQTRLGYLKGPVKILLLHLLLTWTERSIGYRERVRLKQALLYGHLRNTLMDLGSVLHEQGRINQPDDIFFFKYQELLNLLAGAEMLPDSLLHILKARIREHDRKAKMTLPDNFYLAAGEFATEKMAPSISPLKNSGNIYKGISACGGIVKGKAKVLSSVLEAVKIKPGDILVARQTDPGWAPIFPLISGLVVERGGMLSHGAIVAREFGIPAVVGIKQVTAMIKDGTEILVNGDNGSIQF
jgi:pyruvate,water dikinase